MKKNMMILVTIFLFLLVPGHVFAKTCKYYDADDFNDKKRPVVINFSYDWNATTGVTGALEYNPSSEYFKKLCNATWESNSDGKVLACDTSRETSDSLWNGDGNLQWGENLHSVATNIFISDSTVRSDIFTDIYNDRIACPPYILRYREDNRNIADQGVDFFTFAFDELSLSSVKNNIPTLFTGHVKFTSHSGSYSKLYEESTEGPGNVNDNTCMTYDYYMSVLQRLRDENGGSCENNEAFSKKYLKLSELCNAYRSSAIEYTISDKNNSNNDSNNSNVIAARACMTACSALKDDVAIICKQDKVEYSCTSLGPKIINWMYKIIRVVRYGVPIMLIILSAMEYIKAMAADSEDEMKKTTSRFGKRLVAAALVFLIPFILDFILKRFNLPGLNDPFCVG